MKTPIPPRAFQRGQALMCVLIITTLLGTVLAAYLTLMSNANRSTMRSQAWNQTIPVIEAGVEDALTHLNLHGLTNLACDGWQLAGSVYWIRRSIGDNAYVVTITGGTNGSMDQPVIASRGYVQLPATFAAAPAPFLAAVGTSPASGSRIARGVRVTTSKNNSYPGLFVRYGFQAQNSTGIMFDSYDSSNPSYSSNGMYVASRARDNAYVGTIARNAGAMDVHQTAKIVGNVGAGASGTLALASPASVGDRPWVNSAANGGKVQPGHLIVGINIPFPNVTAPTAATTFTPAAGTVDGQSYAYVLGNGNYSISQIQLNSQKMIVTGNATLQVDTFYLSSGELIIKPDASLTLYVTGVFDCGGNTKVNATGRPQQLRYYGLPLNQSFQVRDNSFLVGVFYSPSSTAQFQQSSVLCGAGMFYDIQVQHNFLFHYDESLNSASGRLFTVTSWNEMTPDEVAALPAGVSP